MTITNKYQTERIKRLSESDENNAKHCLIKSLDYRLWLIKFMYLLLQRKT